MTATSGSAPYRFVHRPDLHMMPPATLPAEVDLHGTFAEDPQGYLYYDVIGHGLVRIDPDLRTQAVIPLHESLANLNIHSTKYALIDGQPRLILTANEGERIAIVMLDGTIESIIGRPTIPTYDDPAVAYKPTDTLLIENTLYIADGYGAQMILTYDLKAREWRNSFGGKNTEVAVDGQFGTAHGIATTLDGTQLLIADRWHSRLQIHEFDGTFVRSIAMPKGENYVIPKGTWPCGFHTLTWRDRLVTVIANLYAPGHERPAPIYIVDAVTFDIRSTVRPKEELGVTAAQRLHNVVAHIHDDQLYIVGQSWNPGCYFVLACVD